MPKREKPPTVKMTAIIGPFISILFIAAITMDNSMSKPELNMADPGLPAARKSVTSIPGEVMILPSPSIISIGVFRVKENRIRIRLSEVIMRYLTLSGGI